MTDYEKFDKIWNNFHRFNGQRGKQTKERWERYLFSIWKHHQDWDEVEGFQIKCKYNGYPQSGTLYDVRELATKAGLLIKIGNYWVSNRTNIYKKNHLLFDYAYRNAENKYGKWLDESKINVDLDVIRMINTDIFNKLNKSNNYSLHDNMPYVKTSSKRKIKFNYDFDGLVKLTETMLPRYYDMLVVLNDAAIHIDLKFNGRFIHFNEKGLPTGRPYSPFCSTLNPNKTHKDNSGEYRPDFLKKIGIGDYYEVYDIKSQIPRVNYLFHTGEWKGDDYDFYDEIIKDFHLRNPDPDGDKLSRGKAGSEYYNDGMKQLFMRIYFGKGTEKQSFKGYKDEYMKRNKNMWENVVKIMKMKKEDFVPLTFDEWYELCCSTENICGASIGNLVFWYSFFLETEVKIELLKRGKKVYNVYDGFYFNANIGQEISDILREKSQFVFNNFMSPINKI